MNAVVEPMRAPVARPVAQAMVVRVVGRVDSVRVYDGKRYTLVVCPAADAYSSPQWLEVRSKGALGARGDEVNVDVRVGGFKGRPFRVTDKDTGEIKTVTRCTVLLDLVE